MQAIARFVFVVALVVGLSSSGLVAQGVNVTGDWAFSVQTDQGAGTPTITFKQDGEKLTGTVTGPDGNAIDITDGKVDGDKMSFNVSVNNMTILHEGVVKGDNEIALTAKFPQGSNVPDLQIDLKRGK